jgi:transcriptional antiterminator NusG
MKRWYVVQLYAGYEEAVRTDILKRVQEAKLDHLFGQILIPSTKVQKQFGVDEEENQQLFPGYMLIEFEAVPESLRLVTNTPRVIRFLGGKEPAPLSPSEVNRVLGQVRGEVAVSQKKSSFELGREIEISEGPFSGFVGIIEKIDDAAERLTVMVSIFGRMTPVELGFNQVKR